MVQSRMVLRSWAAWAPGLLTKDDWCAWLPTGGPLEEKQAKPKCKGAPAMLRRRFSMASRMALEAALELLEETGVAADQAHLIYASANGEIATLKALLHTLAHSEPLSPTAFANSVHHTPTGHFGIVTKNKGISRTVSAYRDSFAATVLETAMLLKQQPELPVLVLLADEALPEPFDEMLEAPPFPYGVALLWQVEAYASGTTLDVSWGEQATGEPMHIEPVFEFLRHVLAAQSQFKINSAFGAMSWQKH